MLMKGLSILVVIMCRILLLESQLIVRKNVNSLSHKEWEEFKRGIRIMKERSARNLYDPLGYYFQANIHGWPEFDGTDKAQMMSNRMNWHQCQHGSYFFLVWHRMYIYFFERIIQKVTKNPKFGIPYWDCYELDSRSIPQPFRVPADENNPLYASERCKNINDGKPLSERVVSPYPALRANFFTTFKQNNELNICHSLGGGRQNVPEFLSDREGLLERIPHDNVHLLVGGPNGFMSDLCRAARDPIFVVHHSQTDRIWESWLRSGGTHDMENKYLNQTFDFFDEKGKRGSYRIGDFLDMKKLGYTYDNFIKSEPIKSNRNERPRLYVPIDQKEDLNINYGKRFISLKMKPRWNKFFSQYAKGEFSGLEIKFTLQFDVDYLEQDMIFELYLNLNENTIPYDSHPNFLGTMVNFEVHCVPNFRRQRLSISKCFDITQPLKKILTNEYNFDGLLSQTFNLTFIPKFCDRVYYPKDYRDVIRFNEILVVFFRADETATNDKTEESLSLQLINEQNLLYNKTLTNFDEY